MSNVISRSIPPQSIVNLVNPAVRMVLESPLHAALDKTLLVLHITGRRTGRHYDIPVGYIDLDGRLFVVTQHAWRANLRGRADVEVTHRGRRLLMHAELDDDPRCVAAAFARVIERLGLRTGQRRLGITIHSRRTPSPSELEAAVRDFDLARLTLTAPTAVTGRLER